MIERKDRRTARTADYDLGDGAFQQRCHLADIHYYNHNLRGDGEGGWRKCDWTLIPTADGWGLQYAPYAVSIPRYANGTLIFTNLQSDGQYHKNHTINSAAQAAAVEGTLDGNRVTYIDAFGTGNDLIYEVRRHGVARLIRVRAGQTPAASYVIEFAGAIQRVERGIQRYNLEAGRTKVTDTDSVTDIVIGGGKTHIQPFAAWAGDRREVLSVQLRMDDGVLYLTKTAPEWWDGSEDLYLDDTNTTYTTAADGYVYAFNASWSTARNATTGTVVSAGATLEPDAQSVGGGSTYYVYRTFMWFTNTLPVGAAVQTANVLLFSYGGTGSRKLCIVESTAATTLVADSYNDFNTTLLSSTVTYDNNIGTQHTFGLNATGLALISVGGTSKYCLRDYTYDYRDAVPPDNSTSSMRPAEYTGTSTDPTLVIDYLLTAGGQNLTLLGVS